MERKQAEAAGSDDGSSPDDDVVEHSSDYDDDDDGAQVMRIDEGDEDEEEDEVEDRRNAPSQDSIEIEVLSSDEEEQEPVKLQQASSSPIVSQRSSGGEEEEDDDDDVIEDEEEEQEPEESESDEVSEADAEEVQEEEVQEEEPVVEEVQSQEEGEGINFEFSKPFKPVGPLDLKVQDPLTYDLMDSVEELKILPDYVLSKLTNLWAAKNSDIRALEDKISGIENAVDETEMEVADEPLEQTVESLNEALNRKRKEVKTLKRLKEAAQEREVDVGKQLSRKDAELEKMIAENNSLSTQLSQLIASKCEVQVKLVQLERKEIDLQSKEWRLDNEHAYLQENAKMLEARCDSTDRELLRLKHESSRTICDLEIMLRDSKSECERLELQVSAMKDSTVQYEQQVERLQEIIRQTRDSEVAVQEAHYQEVQAKLHMARLFEEQYEDAHKLAEDYMGMIEALQSTVNEATERYGDLETEYAQDKANLQHELQRKEKMLQSLQEELKSTNEMLEKYSEEEMEENLSLMAPSSVSVRKLVQDNVSFTGLCGSLKAKEEELKLVSAERDELKQSLSAIISEFKERAPLIARDNEALNSTMVENERLLSDYDRMAQELHSEQAECQQAKKTIGMMKRDNERMQIHLDDLSRQTVVLLQEVEILKSQVPLHQRRRTSMGRDDYSQMTPSMMVTERLLEFKDISELQVRNRELMATIRDLTSHIETEAANHQGVDMVKLAEKLDSALVDLKNLQEKEKKYELHIEQLTEQRNHFREMSQRDRSSHDVGVSPMKVATSPLKPVPSMQQVEEDRELKRQLAEAVEAVSRVTNKIDPVLKENKEMAKQTEEMKKEIDEKGIIILKLKAVVENRESKLQSSQLKADEMKRNLDAMETKTKSQTEYLARETKKSRDLQMELQSTQRKLNDSEATLRKLNYELSTLRAQIKSLEQDRDRIRSNTQEHGSIQSSVEQMMQVIAKSRDDGKEHLLRQLQDSKTEADGLKKHLKEETSKLKDELVHLQSALEAERVKVLSAQAEVVSAKNETIEVETRLTASQRDIQALRSYQNPCMDNFSQTEVFVSEEAVREKRIAQRALEFEVLISSLRSELEMAKALNSEYKNIADTSEQTLFKCKEDHKIREASFKLSKDQWVATEANLKEFIKRLEADLAQVRSKVETAGAEANSKLQKALAELAESRSDNNKKQVLIDESQLTKSALKAAEEEVQRMSERLAAETDQNMNYLQVNSDLKAEIAAALVDNAKLLKELEQCKLQISQLEASIDEKDEQLKEVSEEKQEELRLKSEQNTTLFDQLQTMGAELRALKHGASQDREGSSTPGQLNTSGSCDDGQGANTEHLMQLVHYLRREKDTLILQVDDLKTKLIETKTRLELAEQQIEEEERHREVGTPEGPELVTRARYEALVRRLETMNALSESARLQREECVKLRKTNNELQERVRLLLEEAATLQVETRRFEEKAGALQVELALSKGESTRWRTCANQLTEKASQANPEELRRLLQERENLQKQLQTEREAWNRDQEECRRLRASLAALEQQHETNSTELAAARAELERVGAECAQLTVTNKELVEKHKDLVSKELTVRRIAKKYKTQYDTLALEVKQKGMSQAEDTEKALAEQQAKEQELQAQIEALNQEITTCTTQLNDKEEKIQKLQADCQQLKEKDEKMRTLFGQARLSLAEKSKQLEITSAKNTSLTEEIKQLQTASEEMRVRNAALQSQFEAKSAKAEKQLNELRPLAEAYQAQQNLQQVEVLKQSEEPVPQPDAQQESAKTTANIHPFSTVGRGQGQAASVTPVSRDGTPMALLRPMQATESSSSSGTSGDSSGSSTPVVWQQQQQAPAAAAARAVPRDESESSDEAPSGANVQLVRPQDLHTVPTSQVPAAAPAAAPPAAQVPTTSTQAPILKRTRPVEVVPTEEPQPKVAKSEVLPPTEEVEVEEEPLQCTPEAEEVALDSEDDEPQVVIENEEELGSDDETEEAAEIEISEVPDKDIGGTEESIAEERFLQDEEAPAEASGDQNAAQIVLDDPDMEGTILGS